MACVSVCAIGFETSSIILVGKRLFLSEKTARFLNQMPESVGDQRDLHVT